ncbi:MAG: M15 family metallopeptidase [Firmicutes bacterium]|nr:M15 family metallopeptidase [Bacillota bacterium]
MQKNKFLTTLILILIIAVILAATVAILGGRVNGLKDEVSRLKEESLTASGEIDSLEGKIRSLEGELVNTRAENDLLKDELGEMTRPLTKEELRDLVYSLAPDSKLTAENIGARTDEYFQIYGITAGDPVYERIYGRSYVDNPNIGLSDLSYIRMLHYDFDHGIRLGEMIVNADCADDIAAIFRTLYDNGYEIESMKLIEEFWAGDGESSDWASCGANNTSAFCYRLIAGGTGLSNHALGRAIDVNPLHNPFYYVSGGYPVDVADIYLPYMDRTSGDPHMIHYGDICQSTFEGYGFDWGGNWGSPVDFQHFER